MRPSDVLAHDKTVSAPLCWMALQRSFLGGLSARMSKAQARGRLTIGRISENEEMGLHRFWCIGE